MFFYLYLQTMGMKAHRTMAGMAWKELATLITCLLLSSCNAERPSTIFPGSIALRPGDIVLRRGCGLTSRVVLMADRNGAFSHVGIVADSAGTLMVVHAVPGEPDFKGDEDRVKMETPQKFYDPINAGTGCVLRCGDSIAAAKAARAAMQVYRRGTLFDHDYDSRDTARMYCSELVLFAYSRAGQPLKTGPRHSFNLPGMRIDSVTLPSDFLASPQLRRIAGF